MWRTGLVAPHHVGSSRTRARTHVPCIGRRILFINLFIFIYLFLAVLGLRFCVRAFSSCGERGSLFIAVHGPLTVAASLVAEHRLQMRRLSSCGSWAQSPRGMWDLPRPGLEPVSPALAGRFSTTAPPGKPSRRILNHCTTREVPKFQFLNISLFNILCEEIGSMQKAPLLLTKVRNCTCATI